MITPAGIHITVNGERKPAAAFPGLHLTLKRRSGLTGTTHLFDVRLVNAGTAPLRVDAVDLTLEGNSCFAGPATFCVYKEGLTVVGVAGSRQSGDCDFELDPGFLTLTVSNPAGYRWDQPGQFSAEQVGVLLNKDNGEALLAGFVTANNCFCRILMNTGAARSATMRAVIDTNGITVPPGTTVALETLMLATGRDVESLLAAHANELGVNMGALIQPRIPTGWCSYYFYYGQETEGDILENARFLADHRDSIPVGTIQIDDGWQKARGHWLESHPGKFPHGMAWLANEIRTLGFQPGLWVAPFLLAKDTPVYREHGDWLLRNGDGELLTMGDSHFLDPSHPGALAWLAEVFKVLRGWGYTYFKLDFMFVATCHGARYHDASVTRVQAYRQALRVIRKAVGPGTFLLGGTSLIAANVGLVNGCRISTDVTPFWCKTEHTPESPAIVNVCRNIINRGYMHKRLWINDPDCLIVREQHNRRKYAHIPSLTLTETHMLASAMILSGGALFLGDRLGMLPPERLEIIRNVLALTNGVAARPVDRMEREIPRIWFRQGEGTEQAPHLLGLFNWDAGATTITVPIATLGIPTAGTCRCEEVWQEPNPIDLRANPALPLLPHTCRLIKMICHDEHRLSGRDGVSPSAARTMRALPLGSGRFPASK